MSNKTHDNGHKASKGSEVQDIENDLKTKENKNYEKSRDKTIEDSSMKVFEDAALSRVQESGDLIDIGHFEAFDNNENKVQDNGNLVQTNEHDFLRDGNMESESKSGNLIDIDEFETFDNSKYEAGNSIKDNRFDIPEMAKLDRAQKASNFLEIDGLGAFENAALDTIETNVLEDNKPEEVELTHTDKNLENESDVFEECKDTVLAKGDIKAIEDSEFNELEEEMVEKNENMFEKFDKLGDITLDKEDVKGTKDEEFNAFEEDDMGKENESDEFDEFDDATLDKEKSREIKSDEFNEFKEETIDKNQDEFSEFDEPEKSTLDKENLSEIEDGGFDAFEESANIQQDDFNEFSDDEFDNEFVNANEGGDDDFGDFDDFEQATDFPQEQPERNSNGQEIGLEVGNQPTIPTEADTYIEALEKSPGEVSNFIEDYLNRLWLNPSYCQDITFSPVDKNENSRNILNTACSSDLWDKLSRDTVFHNPVTGAVGSFQWTRSEANKAYLHALGVTFSAEEKSSSITRTQSPHLAKKRQPNYLDGKASITSPTASPTSPNMSQTHIRSTSATGGLSIITTKTEETEKEDKKEVDQDLELDIDIARAYCELTEETIRIFPNVKLHAMVTELTRLQRQAAEYLDHLLDQKEQLLMDSETYNDLISCIVGHAQRLREQNPSKDASPAMVSRKKKSGNSSFSNIMRRKTTGHATQSASMGGGVVGVQHSQQQNPVPKKTASSATESRRSM